MKLKADVLIEVFDNKGKRKLKRKFVSRSYVRSFIDLLLVQATQANQTVVCVTGSQTITPRAENFRCADAGITGEAGPFGIVVGTGTGAVAITNTQMGSRIVDGSGAGQLAYQTMQYVAPSTSGGTRKFSLVRSFLNNSGGSITVNECGINGLGIIVSIVQRMILVARDIISGGVAIPNGDSLAITYIVSITV